MVIRKTEDTKSGDRIMISTAGSTVKGYSMEIRVSRTTVMEVGDGECLPSVRTDKLIKIPNSMLINSSPSWYMAAQ